MFCVKVYTINVYVIDWVYMLFLILYHHYLFNKHFRVIIITTVHTKDSFTVLIQDESVLQLLLWTVKSRISVDLKHHAN